jgi:hypothetical protein
MRPKKIKFIAILLFIIGITGLKAQTTISASGGNAVSNEGSVSYSIGQVVYSTISGANVTVSQGVQQPYEISAVTGIDPDKMFSLVCSTYPNPTSDNLTLKIEGERNVQYMASLYDINGKLLFNQKIEATESTIPMKMCSPATYFLRITSATHNNTSSSVEIKSFKIIKK